MALGLFRKAAAGGAGLLSLLHRDVLDRQDEYAREFLSASPFPHVVINNFFSPELCERLLREFPPFEKGCALNENGQLGGKACFENVRDLGATFVQVDDLIRSPEFLQLVGKITGIPDLLYDPDYVGGGTHENRTTQSLDPHVDFNYHPKNGWHRRLNLIVYLNPTWDAGWGGCLEFHKDPYNQAGDEVKSVVPLLNCCAIFATSERSWHGFRAITPPPGGGTLSRRSFAIYLYTKERPAAETAPLHSTVYVDRPLPASVRAGETLPAADMDQITELLIRRSHHVARLFKRDQQFAGVVASLASQILTHTGGRLSQDEVGVLQELVRLQDGLLKNLYEREKLFSVLTTKAQGLRNEVCQAPLRLPFLGAVEQVGAADGYWGDRWASPAVEFVCRAAGPIRALKLHGCVPREIPGGQDLTVTVNDKNSTYRLGAGPFECQVPCAVPAGQEARVRIAAARSMNPAKAGLSGDSRDLAFILTQVAAA